MTLDISSNPLLQRLINVGIGDLPGDRLKELAQSLENRADNTGLASPLLVAEAIWLINSFFDEYNEGGGLRTDFLHELDDIIRSHIHEIQIGDPLKSTAQARQLLKEIRRKLSQYQP